MKKHLIVLIFILPMFLSTSLLAQDKIYSLSLKQYEIEDAIRKSIKPFLKRKDYVVKVRLTGDRRMDVSNAGDLGTRQGGATTTLPGFELEDKSAVPKISDVIGNTYWRIKRMRIDLIMHKVVSPSVDTFIRETVPVVSELDPARGDLFNYIPIIPKSIEEGIEEENALTGIRPLEKRYYGLSLQEWIYVGIALFSLLIIAILIWRMVRIRRNLTALEDAIEHEQMVKKTGEKKDPVEELRKEREERLTKQEALVNNAILKEKNEQIGEEVITQLLGRKDWAAKLIEEFGKDKQGIEKMSGLVSIMGANTSRKLFAGIMGEEKYLEIEKMAEDVALDPAQEQELLREVQKTIFTNKLLYPEDVAIDPFAFLKDLTTGQIGFLIRDEPVKIKAIILSQLTSMDTAGTLEKLSKEERGKVVLEIGKINDLPLELLEKVAYNLADKARSVPDDNTVGFDGIDRVVDVISESNSQVRQDIINNLRVSDRKLSEKVESRLFLFESIPVVPQDVLTEVVRNLPSEDVITAMVGSSKKLQEKTILCFPDKIRRTLVSSLKSQKPTTEAIKVKQKLIVQAMQKMAENKRVDLRKIQAAWEKASAQKPPAKSA
ncbi:MAG: hypothetical protein GY866_01675 [Proteobacteria bacterium]|nr:hypothetical protein [Pseudomonadota bacterium]